MRRLLFLFALLVAGTATAKDPPAGRPAFDRTLLPRGVDYGVLALRPAEIAEHAGGTDDTVTALMVQSLKAMAAFFDGEVKADDLPAVTAVEQAAFNLGPKLTLSGEAGGSTVAFNTERFSGYVRTTAKFDWAAVVKKWFPKTTAKAHGDAEYLSVPLKVGKWEGAMGVYVPDDRTAVFDFDTAVIEKLIDRRAKEEAAEEPAGWDAVKGCSVAYAVPAGDRKWLTEGKDLSEDSQTVAAVVKATEVACVGLTCGKETKVVAVFTAVSDDDAEAVLAVVSAGVTAAANAAEESLGGPLEATAKRDGSTVRVEGVVKANVVKHLAEQMAKGK
jgi:hypothetical protein